MSTEHNHQQRGASWPKAIGIAVFGVIAIGVGKTGAQAFARANGPEAAGIVLAAIVVTMLAAWAAVAAWRRWPDQIKAGGLVGFHLVAGLLALALAVAVATAVAVWTVGALS